LAKTNVQGSPAAVPFLKMLDLPWMPNGARFVAQVFEGSRSLSAATAKALPGS
jgi:hypothetical protein